MADFPQDLFYGVSQYLDAQDLAAARVTCHAFRGHISSLVDFIHLSLNADLDQWNAELQSAVAAFPHISQLLLRLPTGRSDKLQALSNSIVELLSARLQVLQLDAPQHAGFNWSLVRQLCKLGRLTTLKVNGVVGATQYDPTDNPFEGFSQLKCLHIKSCWPRVPIPALLALKSLQELKFTCDLWNDAEVSTLSSLTALTSLSLEGAQMSHQVQHTTLESLAQLPRLQALHLGTLRPFQACGVIDNTPSTCKLSLCAEGDAIESFRLVNRCQPANTYNLHLTIKGVLPDPFFSAFSKLTSLQSVDIFLRSYRRAAPNAAPLPNLNLSHLSSLCALRTFVLKTFGKGDMQQAVAGEQAAQLLRSCPHLHTFAVDCLDTRDAISVVQALPHASCLNTLTLGCVSNPPSGANRAQQVGLNGEAIAPAPAPVQDAMDVNEPSVAILPLQALPPRIENVHIHVSDALVVDLGSAYHEGVVLAGLKHFALTGWVMDAADVVCITACMPSVQQLELVQPVLKNKQGHQHEQDGEDVYVQKPAQLDGLLTLPHLQSVHVEQQNSVLSELGVQQLKSKGLKHASVKCLLQQAAGQRQCSVAPVSIST